VLFILTVCVARVWLFAQFNCSYSIVTLLNLDAIKNVFSFCTLEILNFNYCQCGKKCTFNFSAFFVTVEQGEKKINTPKERKGKPSFEPSFCTTFLVLVLNVPPGSQ